MPLGARFFLIYRGSMMIPETNKKYLITCDDWFFSPDGEPYKAVFGTVLGVYSAKEALGIETNKQSTNWYVTIGNMIVAGCQIHYCIRTDNVSFEAPIREIEHDGKLNTVRQPISRIYNSDQ